MTPRFELAGGSAIGRDHRVIPRNNQDAFYILEEAGFTIGVVTDGCGSGARSEVGAQLGVRLIAAAIGREIAARGCPERIKWPQVQAEVLATLRLLATQLGDNGRRRETVEEYLLFTVVGAVLGAETATFFALGDGVIIINGSEVPLGPFRGNQPPYMGYGLLDGYRIDIDPADLNLAVKAQLPLQVLEHFLIGCDGVAHRTAQNQPLGLLDLCEQGTRLPGLSRPIGGIEQFWSDDAIFRNPAVVSRRLKLIARDWPVKDPEPGLLADDTTLVVGRRAPVQPQP